MSEEEEGKKQNKTGPCSPSPKWESGILGSGEGWRAGLGTPSSRFRAPPGVTAGAAGLRAHWRWEPEEGRGECVCARVLGWGVFSEWGVWGRRV